MELLFGNAYYDHVPEGEEEEEYVDRYAHALSTSLSEFDEHVKCKDTDIGHGADWPVVLVQIFENQTFLTAAGAGGLFLLGEQINRNLDAWLAIAGKLLALFRKIRPARIDENAAMLIALNDAVQSNKKAGGINVSVQIVEFTPLPSGESKLDKRPDALYLVTISTNDRTVVYGVKSHGNIEFKHEYSKAPIDFVPR